MNNNIVQHFFRGEDEPPVEIKVACTAAASPPGLLFPDGDAAVGDAHDAGIIFCLAGSGCGLLQRAADVGKRPPLAVLSVLLCGQGVSVPSAHFQR